MLNNSQNINSNESHIKITYCKLFNTFLFMILYGIWASTYINDWMFLTKEETKTYTSKLLFCFMIYVICKFLNSIKDFCIMSTLIEKHMTTKDYESKMNFDNKYFKKIIKIFGCFVEIISILLMQIFIPYTKENCYDYTHSMCTNGRIGAFMGALTITSYCLGFLILCIYCILICLNPQYFQNRRNMITSVQRIPVLNNLFLLQQLTVLDKECPICVTNGVESNDSSFVKLPCECDYYYHHECIKNWFNTGNLTCPTCRTQISEEYIRSNNPPITMPPTGLTIESTILSTNGNYQLLSNENNV